MFNFGTDMSKQSIMIQSLLNPEKKDYRIAVTFNDVIMMDSKIRSGYCNRQFVEYTDSDRAKRGILRRIRSHTAEGVPPQLKVADVTNVIRYVKSSKALGPQ